MQKWMNLGVSGQAGWPREQCEVCFGGAQLVLMPRTEDTMASVHIEVSKLDHVDAMTLVNRFLSLLSWCEGQPLINHYGWSGNPVPVAVRAQNPVRSVSEHFVFAREPLGEQRQRLALALYREGNNLNSVPYQFLSYFKILNIFWRGGKEIKKELASILPEITDARCRERIAAITNAGDDPAEYLYRHGRCAVAHAYSDPLVDPDDASDVRRLSEDLPVIRAVAEHLISTELNISRCLWEDAPKE
jgi:hypothetical protein